MSTKFKLYNFSGQPKSYYEVERHVVGLLNPSDSKNEVSHNIIVVDRSGSMYYDIDPLKEMLIKLLTLDEYENSGMKVSLISYSSHGDCTCHFERVGVEEVMKFDSPYQKSIRQIRVTGLTCISQAMQMAVDLIDDNDLTGITLHSDGYANDYSPASERSAMEEICLSLKDRNVFVNTIAYRTWSDFKFLSKVANDVSGKCVQANSVKEVYDTLYEAANTLNGKAVPTIVSELEGSDYQVFVSTTSGKINGASDKLSIKGVSGADATVYRYTEVSQQEYDDSSFVEKQKDDSVFAFAKAQLSEGNLNLAKYALISGFNQTLAEKHSRALTNGQIAEMSADLEAIIFSRLDYVGVDYVSKPINLAGSTTIIDLIPILESNRDNILVDMEALGSVYKRRGVKRIRGVRDDEGKVIEPWLDTEYLDDSRYVQMGTFDVNRNNATINLLIARPSRLIKVADASPVTNVAGINVSSLSSFNNYTVVGDGEVTLPELKVKISSKAAFEALKKVGVLEGPADYDFDADYTIALSDMPVVSFEFEGDVSEITDAYEDVLSCKVLASIFAAVSKEDSDLYTSEQVGELKDHYLSKSLNINFPMTNEYDDLDTALNNGSVDTRVSYKVDVGTADILNVGKLKSANAFLDRMYEAYEISTDDKLKEKPKFDLFFDGTISFRHKKLSARTKITAVDDLTKPIFDDFLGLDANGSVKEILGRVGINKSPMDLVKGGVASILEAKKQIEAHIEKQYLERIIPLTFYIGATGLIPDEIQTKAETADEITSRLPDLKLSKAEKEGTFFQVGDMIVTVYAKSEYYSTGKTAESVSAGTSQEPVLA